MIYLKLSNYGKEYREADGYNFVNARKHTVSIRSLLASIVGKPTVK